MKPKTWVLIIALLLASIFLLWPRSTNGRDSAGPQIQPATTTGAGANPVEKSIPSARGEPGDPVGRIRVPETANVELNPESPPEPTLEWKIARQQAMLKTLQRHIENLETTSRTATNQTDRQAMLDQLDILKAELALQRQEFTRLQQQGLR